MKAEYARRAARPEDVYRYSLLNPANLFTYQSRQRALVGLLNRHGAYPLASRRILEVGCGAGRVLLDLVQLGAVPGRVFGIDLLTARLAEARAVLPHVGVAAADGQRLPFAERTFDLVFAFTAFSSILDDAVRAHMAAEVTRVLAPGGAVVWYDFWLNPGNRETRGIGRAEVRRLFPALTAHFRRVTLAPPITRRLVPRFTIAAGLLERARVFNSHEMALLVKPPSPGVG
jgi:SAM-dependent methyltransferase